MVGHRLGEFSPTRVFKGHGSKKIAEAQPQLLQDPQPVLQLVLQLLQPQHLQVSNEKER